MSKEGKGRNQITCELARTNIKDSAGSVSKIIKEWKQKMKTVTTPEINQQYETMQSVNAQ